MARDIEDITDATQLHVGPFQHLVDAIALRRPALLQTSRILDQFPQFTLRTGRNITGFQRPQDAAVRRSPENSAHRSSDPAYP